VDFKGGGSGGAEVEETGGEGFEVEVFGLN